LTQFIFLGDTTKFTLEQLNLRPLLACHQQSGDEIDIIAFGESEDSVFVFVCVWHIDDDDDAAK
jgi:hypothetical protein